MRRHLLLTGLVVALGCGVIAACDGPEPLADNPLAPTKQALIERLEVSGPDTFSPGQDVAFTLIAVMNNGTRPDVTTAAQWTSGNASVTSTQGRGRYRGNGSGDTQINARYGSLSASKEVVVIPAGTFRVSGRIVESDTGFSISGARVEARNSAGSGPATESDASGFFKLFGVTSNAEIVVARAGYVESTQRITIDKHATVNLTMNLSGPRPDVVGTYSVTLDLTGCGAGFPLEYARRSYAASVRQEGQNIEVRFTEPAFAVNSVTNRGNLLQGRLQGNTLVLEARTFWYYYYGPSDYPYFVETLPDDTRLMLSGSATLTESNGNYSGKWNGWASLYGPRFPNDRYLSGCNTGQMTFTRR